MNLRDLSTAGSAPRKPPRERRRAAPDDARAAWSALHADASARYRRGGRFAWHFARGKLRHDPVFRALLEHGDIGAGARVLDIGCGQGLLASLLAACDDAGGAPRLAAGWAAPPTGARYTGIELMPRDVARAQRRACTGSTRRRRFAATTCAAPRSTPATWR